MDRPAAITAVIAVAVAATLLVAVAAASGVAAPEQRGRTGTSQPAPDGQPLQPVERFVGPAREVPASELRRERAARAAARGFDVVRVRAGRSVRLYAKPEGRAIGTVAARTEFGSPSVMSVVTRKAGWLAVTTTSLPNGRVGWVRAGAAGIDRGRVRMAISVDLSRRTVELRRGQRLVKRVEVAVGRPGSSTPRGRFAVTDKLAGSRYGSYYGCCILALNGRQPNPPPGWRGGNRLAIHGTDAPGSIGQASSAGCLRAADADLRVLMRRVPLGTPVFVHG